MGGVPLAAELWETVVPGARLAALAPHLPMKFGPIPSLPLGSPERGAESSREECVNFLAGGSCPRPEWAAFRRGARGAPGFVYL